MGLSAAAPSRHGGGTHQPQPPGATRSFAAAPAPPLGPAGVSPLARPTHLPVSILGWGADPVPPRTETDWAGPPVPGHHGMEAAFVAAVLGWATGPLPPWLPHSGALQQCIAPT